MPVGPGAAAPMVATSLIAGYVGSKSLQSNGCRLWPEAIS